LYFTCVSELPVELEVICYYLSLDLLQSYVFQFIGKSAFDKCSRHYLKRWSFQMMSETKSSPGLRKSDGWQHVQRLWLVRHGNTEWNSQRRMCGHSDIALSPLGLRQASWVAGRLRREKITAIYSSDLSRARQTAEIIAQRCALTQPIQLSPAWREMSFGDWEGLTYAQIAQDYAQQLGFFTDPQQHSPPNGESFSALVQRMQIAFVQLARAASERGPEAEGAIVLVCHGGALRALLCSLLEIPSARQWQLRIDHGSLSALDFLLGVEDPAATATLVTLNRQAPTYARTKTNA
jgi:broad specificity phosphatase PhoE